jgi:hypothetical protein
MTDRKTAAQGKSQPKSGSSKENSNLLQPPSPDQAQHLEEIKRSSGSYDPKVVVGGPGSIRL